MILALATLTAALTGLSGQPVQVNVTEGAGSWGGSAMPGGWWINIGRDALTDAEQGGGHGLTVLLHELGHTTGIRNEAEANCYALHHLRPFWLQNWGVEYDAWARGPVSQARYDDGYASTLQQSAIYHCEAP